MDDKNQYVSGLTVGPTCFIDGKHGRRKQRFTLLNAALDMISTSPNEKPRKTKTSVKSKDDKINGNKNYNGNNTEGWKKLVGSMRPLHMQASRSPFSSPRHSEYSESALSCPLPNTASSNSSTSGYSSPQNNLQDFENMGTMSTNVSPNNQQELVSTGSSRTMSPSSPNNLQELASTGTSSTMSPRTPNNLQELASTGSSGTMSRSSPYNLQEQASTGSLGTMSPNTPNNLQQLASMGSSGTMSPSAPPNNLQKLAMTGSTGTMSPSATKDNLQKVEGTLSHNTASPNNLQEVSNTAGTKSTSVSHDIVQEVSNTGTSVSANNPAELARAGSMRKNSISSGNLHGLGRKGKMSSSKLTSNLQDLSWGKIRQYKSALNLHDLDLNEETETETDAEEESSDDKLLENCPADMMIDVKADQFIKNFYQQMESQHKGKGRRRRN